MVAYLAPPRWLSFALTGAVLIPFAYPCLAAPASSVKQYEAEALRRYRTQKAQVDAAQRAEEAEKQAAERSQAALARQQRLTSEHEQRRMEEEQNQERSRSQSARLCEEAVSREAWDYAITSCKSASASGDVNALYRLGQLVANGFGTPQDPAAGYNLILRAARLGSDDAYFSLCGMLRHGFGTPPSASKAATCYMSLAKSDSSKRDKAENELRDIYVRGEASPPSPSVPAQLSWNAFEASLRQMVARDTARVGWGLNVSAAVNVLVGKTGRVEGCSVSASDNEPLNELACQAATNALSFKPALDATAQPMMSLYSLPFRIQTVTKACAEFSREPEGILGGLIAALACK